MLVDKVRAEVDAWRDHGYDGASDVTKSLFEFWFEQDHDVSGFPIPFRYYFGQREAIETLVYLVEVLGNRDAQPLIERFATVTPSLLQSEIRFQTTADGQRQVVRPSPTQPTGMVLSLPPIDLRRYATKMATGSGKTWVMAMAIVWSYFHRQRVAGSDLSTNFLLLAPNVIVYQRLEREFASGRIFNELPLIPPEWKGAFGLKVILREDSIEPDPSGNLFLTNIQRLYESRTREWTPATAVEVLLGPPPSKDMSSYERPLVERLRTLPHLVAINDEAHHVHDEDLAWTKALLSLKEILPHGLALWLDFSATPRDQNGNSFPWVISDYPLAQAVEDRIVKAPLIVTNEDDPRFRGGDPENVTKENLTDKYGPWLRAAYERWQEHSSAYKAVGVNPILFIMTERSAYADEICDYLVKSPDITFKASDVLVIHTDNTGEITKADLEKARTAARDVDNPKSRIKAIVSVMMLREGWDVRNVSVVLGLRPFTAKAEILPEQVIGRGLRLMRGVTPDRTQTLEVLGTQNLLKVLRESLEAEGVSVASTTTPPPLPVNIAALRDRLRYDIAIPITKPILTHNVKTLAEIDPLSLGPVYDEADVMDEPLRLKLRMEFATLGTEVHEVDVLGGPLPMVEDLIAGITKKVIAFANLSGHFAELYPIVRKYVQQRCFGSPVDLETEEVRSYLNSYLIQEGIGKYLAKQVSHLSAEERPLEFEKASFRLSETKPFQWRRDLPPLECDHTVFNYVATYNAYERHFAGFLDKASDIDRFASLGTTEQGDSGTVFRVDYLKPSGAIGFYHPDWVAVQRTSSGEINWIIETKGRVWESTAAKDAAISHWCDLVTFATGVTWRFMRVNQTTFEKLTPAQLADLIPIFT